MQNASDEFMVLNASGHGDLGLENAIGLVGLVGLMCYFANLHHMMCVLISIIGNKKQSR